MGVHADRACRRTGTGEQRQAARRGAAHRRVPGRAGRLLAGGDLPALRPAGQHAPLPQLRGHLPAVEDGSATLGLLPVENSQAGSINQAYDLLLDHDLRVVGEVKLRVRHCLLAPPGTKPRTSGRVHSHPQALAQCERYLQHPRLGSRRRPTTRPARPSSWPQTPSRAPRIASALAGQTYGLEVLDAGIEDSPDNTTRFFLLGPRRACARQASTRPRSSSPRCTRRARSTTRWASSPAAAST